MNSHCIRLRDPWNTVSHDGRTRHARKFGRPRTLEPHEHVWLTCAVVPAAAEVYVNGKRVGAVAAGQSFAADITGLLSPRNEVVFDLAGNDSLGEVSLEVRG